MAVTMVDLEPSQVPLAPQPNCSGEIPSAKSLISDQVVYSALTLSLGLLFTCVALALYIEQIIYILRKFEIKTRKGITIWILGLFPLYSLCALIGVMVPRAGVFVTMVANSYFATCVYTLVRLMVNYAGGSENLWARLHGTHINLRAPPCCCWPCLHKAKFNKPFYLRVMMMVLQVAIARPLLMFFAAVMWADGVYSPGQISLNNAYPYIQTLNLISTLISLYGFFLIKKVLGDVLGEFAIPGKFLCFQMVLVVSVVPNIILAVLVATGAVPCNEVLPSTARAERLSNAVELVFLMPICLLARYYYRRFLDGSLVVDIVTRTEVVMQVESAAETKTEPATREKQQNGQHVGQSMPSFEL